MGIIVKATVEFEIREDQTWLEVIEDFYEILSDSEGDITVGHDDSLCVEKLDGWNMYKMIRFVDYLGQLEFQVDYLKRRISEYNSLEDFMGDLEQIFKDALSEAKLEVSSRLRIGQDEVEQ